jgi:hypothetical protein
MRDPDHKGAMVSLKLKADSGYSSEEKHRVSANQWAAILAVAAGTIDAAEALKLLQPIEVRP